ncbi:MAG: LysR substrate-binding domain-containing protein [Pseudomonadota bacterium]
MSGWLPSLNALRAFESVSRLLSYRAAAEELNVTPGAVKHLVAKLEASLGAPLLQRKGHSLELTAQGVAGKSDLALAMWHFSEAVKAMRRHHPNKRVIVSVEASLASLWLSPKLEQFWARHPDIDLLIDVSQQIKSLERSDVDIAIRYGVARDPGLIATRLFDDFVFPACSPGLAADARLTDLRQLRDTPLIHWDMSQMAWARETRRWFSWDSWLQHMGIEGIDTTKGKRFSDYGLAVQAAASGQGVMLAGWPAMQETLEAGLLLCPFANGVVETDLGFDLVTRADVEDRPEVLAFKNWIVEAAAEVGDWR